METHTGDFTLARARKPLVKVSQNPEAATVVLTRCRKLYFGGRRIHHGLTGGALLGAGLLLHRKAVTAIGVALVIHDRRDFPFPLTDPNGWGPK
ncbi:MAG: hypothetical protein J0H98_07230 [Solirubrobacterales bacterium]|nr:hypothetical protein [Solirubrobacterales bacterium]